MGKDTSYTKYANGDLEGGYTDCYQKPTTMEKNHFFMRQKLLLILP